MSAPVAASTTAPLNRYVPAAWSAATATLYVKVPIQPAATGARGVGGWRVGAAPPPVRRGVGGSRGAPGAAPPPRPDPVADTREGGEHSKFPLPAIACKT